MRHYNQGRGRRHPATPQGAHGRASYTLLHPSRVAMAFTLRCYEVTSYRNQLRSYRGLNNKTAFFFSEKSRSKRSF